MAFNATTQQLEPDLSEIVDDLQRAAQDILASDGYRQRSVTAVKLARRRLISFANIVEAKGASDEAKILALRQLTEGWHAWTKS